MKRPKERPVPGLFLHLGHTRDDLFLCDIGADLFSEHGSHLFHIRGDGGVFCAEIRMALSCLDNDQAVVLGSEIIIDLFHHWL